LQQELKPEHSEKVQKQESVIENFDEEVREKNFKRIFLKVQENL